MKLIIFVYLNKRLNIPSDRWGLYDDLNGYIEILDINKVGYNTISNSNVISILIYNKK